jgi:hypothetical protein
VIKFTYLSQGVVLVAILLALVSCEERATSVNYEGVKSLKENHTLESWEKCEYDLLYLVGKKDRDAFIAATRVLPTLIRSSLITHLDWLLVALFENAPDVTNLLRSLPEEDLKVFVHYCDIHSPLDWNVIRNELVKEKKIPE